MKQQFYASGKLMLSGEYFVLDGAKAFAIPTKKGQSLFVEPTSGLNLHWISKSCNGEVWFEAEYRLPSLNIKTTSDTSIAQRLQQVLRSARSLNPSFLQINSGMLVTTVLEFPRLWGLGSSSTLIYCIAQWSSTNPFQLLASTFGGSAYDIACAGANSPILYQVENNISSIETVNFSPDFLKHLYFVYLDKKQNSRSGIRLYQQHRPFCSSEIDKISSLSMALTKCIKLSDFEDILQELENTVSYLLQLVSPQHLHFSDFDGVVKSLGAWGGDFVLASKHQNPSEIKDYFLSKGFSTIIPYEDMAL